MRLAPVTSRTTEILERLWKIVFISDDDASCKSLATVIKHSIIEHNPNVLSGISSWTRRCDEI